MTQESKENLGFWRQPPSLLFHLPSNGRGPINKTTSGRWDFNLLVRICKLDDESVVTPVSCACDNRILGSVYLQGHYYKSL